MRRYVLIDTTPLAAYLFRRPAAVALLAPLVAARRAATSVLVYGEFHEYIRNRTSFLQRERDLRDLLAEIHPYTLTYPILQRYAAVRRQLRAPGGGGVIGDIDTLIAATALERKLTLITSDSDFRRVTQLSIHHVDRVAFRR